MEAIVGQAYEDIMCGGLMYKTNSSVQDGAWRPIVQAVYDGLHCALQDTSIVDEFSAQNIMVCLKLRSSRSTSKQT